MKIAIYPTSEVAPLVRPAGVDREWMSNTTNRFAYRCLPLNIANQHGWEVLCPADVSARWNGGSSTEDIEIRGSGPERWWPQSHFGHGVLTFVLNMLIKTDPGYNLMISGPLNSPKDSIYPLSGVVETDWSPYTFTMNWKLTKPFETISFTVGEPICHFYPVERALIEDVEIEVLPLSSDPILEEHYNHWVESRQNFNATVGEIGSEANRQGWQRNYFRGLMPDGSRGSSGHQTNLDLCPVSRKESR